MPQGYIDVPLHPSQRRQAPPPSTPPADTEDVTLVPQRLGALGIETVSDDEWEAMTPTEKVRGLVTAMGLGVGGMLGLGLSDTGKQTLEHPGATLATAAVAPLVGKLPPILRGGSGGVPPATTSRLPAGLRTLITHATPSVKYIASKTALTAAHVPEPVAEVLAATFSGYAPRGRGAVPPGPPAPAPAPVPTPPPPVGGTGPTIPGLGRPTPPTGPTVPGLGRPPVMPPATPVPAGSGAAPPPPLLTPAPAQAPVRAAPPPTTPLAELTVAAPRSSWQGWSVQRVKNEVGLAARRAKLTLTKQQLEQADALVLAGQSPQSAVRVVATR